MVVSSPRGSSHTALLMSGTTTVAAAAFALFADGGTSVTGTEGAAHPASPAPVDTLP